MKPFDVKSLSAFDGTAGQPVYVAYRGKVFDVTGSRLWKGGFHMQRHAAAADLTGAFAAAPHGEEVFERVSQVGWLAAEAEPASALPAYLSSLLERFPMLRRHPHPMTVHFPIVFLLSFAFFACLLLASGDGSFETTAFHCLAGGVLFMPMVMLTGWFTWWLNYLARPMRAVQLKIALSSVALLIAAALFLWRLGDPSILFTPGGARAAYLAAALSLVPLIAVVGWLGAGLTFPIERR